MPVLTQHMADRIFGDVIGYPEGSLFKSRQELSFAGVHRPSQAGISGSQKEGADSIILTGGYEDDEDYGNELIYTGYGGRDNESGKQVTDQVLRGQNVALVFSCQNGLPVRVIRGPNPNSNYAPAWGYRYDGLCYIESYWREKGLSGFYVWRFRMSKLSVNIGQSLLSEEKPSYEKTNRTATTIQRIIRSTALASYIKKLYDYQCQVCKTSISTNAGRYAEAAHIKPLGIPHNGPDNLANLLCLCPNHHVMFDFGGFSVSDDLTLIGLTGKLVVRQKHKINTEFLQYHREHFYQDTLL